MVTERPTTAKCVGHGVERCAPMAAHEACPRVGTTLSDGNALCVCVGWGGREPFCTVLFDILSVFTPQINIRYTHKAKR